MRILPVVVLLICPTTAVAQNMKPLVVSENSRFLQHADGTPFFWLGDTGWLLFQKLDRAEADRYLENRRRKGFNVVQVMVLHSADAKNSYGASALVSDDPARPRLTTGADLAKPDEYDYWDHVDWIVKNAAAKGIYMAMVPAWGSVVQNGALNSSNVRAYARFLAERYRSDSNIIWLNGGDTRGDRNTEVWNALGQTLEELDPAHLITFHPFGRTQSSTWFHNALWLDFNMFQSGHRRYDQDDTPNAKGEDNWRYVQEDYARKPVKPTLDGEPSYENIPQGLHDTTQPYWTDRDCRRYAYWSVFAGAFGHTYGNNAVMQMHKPDSGKGAYGPRNYWYEALDDPGAGQMQHLKKLMLSRPFLERVPDQDLLIGYNGSRYDYAIATRGASYLFAYSHTGKELRINMGRISGKNVRAWWFNPVDGSSQSAGTFENKRTREFAPPSSEGGTRDWVLVLDDAERQFPAPGTAAVR